VPSATESLFTMGVRPVGVTRFCPAVPDAAVVGGTKNPEIESIARLRPDVVVMCVEENRREDADALTAMEIEVVGLDIDTVDDVSTQLAILAERVGVAPPRLALPPPRPKHGRVAFVPTWRRPWMSLSGRTYGASVLDRLGVDVAFADAGDRYPTVDLDEVRALAPSIVVAPDEPYPFGERHRAELETIAPVVFVDGQDLFWWGTRTPDALRRLGTALG
jgi:ABC-type Fe3+-hydroxamate transport system substrate-binding protein